MPAERTGLDKVLYDLTMGHLAKLREYTPGPVRKTGGGVDQLVQRYREDPLFSIFGLDSREYVAAALSGGTITSIHRKIGDIYEACVKAVFSEALGLAPTDLVYEAIIRSGSKKETRSTDVYLEFARVPDDRRRQAMISYGAAELAALTKSPKIDLIGLGLEVRHCYQTGDSKRTQADEAMARHLLVSAILPIMPLFRNQSNPGIVRRYRSVWVVKEGMASYEMVREVSGYDLYGFMTRNKEEFRKPVIEMLQDSGHEAANAF